MHSDLAQQKKILRNEARARRAALAAACPDFAARIADQIVSLDIPPASIVSSYVALEGEADPKLLADALAIRGHEVCFPRVHQKAQPLHFHTAMPGEHFVKSAFGVLEPRSDWPLATPSVLLVPLLAFDRDGYRLGYGGGFYDRTLASLRARGRITAIGIAFAGLEVAAVPHDASDQKLDMLVTERGVRRFSVI